MTGWGGWAKKLKVTQKDKSPNKKKNFGTTRPALLVKNHYLLPIIEAARLLLQSQSFTLPAAQDYYSE